jgi:hypothetical protein
MTMTMPMRALIPELEDILHEVPRAKPMVNPKKVFCKGFPKDLVPSWADDPIDALEKIVNRAVGLMTHTINEMNAVRDKIAKGAKPDPSFIREQLGSALARRMNMDASSRKVWMNNGPGGIGLVIRWLTNMRDLLKSGDLRYECLSNVKTCGPGDTAWVYQVPDDAALKDPGRPDYYQIHLCRGFWTAEITGDPDADISATQLDLQALLLVSVSSNVYYSSLNSKGVGPWFAACMAQFVAETNGVEPNPGYKHRCEKN